MMKRIRKGKQKLVVMFCLALLLTAGLCLVSAKEAEGAGDKVKVRFVFTTDLHGQATTTDYETGGSYPEGSLAKAYTLIKDARSERPKGNTLTFDIGDVLFDYTTEYLWAKDSSITQPIYKAMAKVGYDAITLGNHDFDYGYDYIVNQLKASGMKSKVVLSNVVDSLTGKYIWKENMLLTRTMKSESGEKVKIKVGIIGETIPNLTSKTESYVGILRTEDIVANVRSQAADLKKKGADIVVVLAHSGIGPKEPEENYKNVTYALSKLKDVDVVLCGHEHNMFPSSDSASANYYTLPGVDKKTGLMNGTCVVMSADRGQSIGVADVTITVADGKKEITSMKGSVRKVKSSTKADSSINKIFGALGDEMMATIHEHVAELAEGQVLQNYYGLVQDNGILQLLNDAKMSYAMNYIANSKPEYKDYPVVALSEYGKYGDMDSEDFISVSGSITGADVKNMQSYNRYIAIYEITGSQLRKWIEWAASAYDTVGKKIKWEDDTMNELKSDQDASALVSEEWLEEWGKFYVFDGVEYTLDLSQEPRYNQAGQKISDSSRVISLTCNGEKVTSDTKFVLVCDRITKTYPATAGLDEQYITRGFNRSQAIFKEYLKNLSAIEPVKADVDYNWGLQVPDGKKTIVMMGRKGLEYVKGERWFDSVLRDGKSGAYVLCNSSLASGARPHVVLSAVIKETTNRNVPVRVQAVSANKVVRLKYAMGNYSADSPVWSGAAEITGGQFEAAVNGIYTVCAEDGYGNRSVAKIRISNINTGVLQLPKVITYTNRKTSIKGTAEPGAVIYFETGRETYSGIVESDGSYSYDLPAQKAGTTIYVFVKDASGRSSSKLPVVIKRTGPDQPVLEAVTNKQKTVRGSLNDEHVSVYAMIGSSIYTSREGAEAYRNCEKYSKSKTIVTTKVEIDDDGSYAITIPAQNGDKKITVYTIDHLGRVSRANSTVVKTVAPNPPSIYNSYSVMRHVSGKVYNPAADTEYKITVKVNGKAYYGKTDLNGYFTVPVDMLEAGDSITVKAEDEKDGVTRSSVVTARTTGKISSFIASHDEETELTEELTTKSLSLKGICTETGARLTLIIGNSSYETVTDSRGAFQFDLPGTLPEGKNIYIMRYSEYGSLKSAAKFTVKVPAPEQPELLDEITNSTKEVSVVCEDQCEMVLKAGDKTYTVKKGTFDGAAGGYVYTFEIDRIESGETVKIYGRNKGGSGKSLKVTVTETAPDTPDTEKVREGDKKITGTVHLIPETGSEEETPTVSSTGTKVFAKIGEKTYEGTVEDDGSFRITVPKQKEGTKITVWGENKNGRGPSGSVTVKKK